MPADLKNLSSLSRFFFAGNSDELKAAYDEFESTPTVDDWSAVEFSFNRLFVGPGALQAPPYASIYLDGSDKKLMGASTLEMRELYASLGLVSPWLNQIPDDHISLELDALWQIETTLQTQDSKQLSELRAFLYEHLQRWVPIFANRIRATVQVHAVILYMLNHLESTLSLAENTPALP